MGDSCDDMRAWLDAVGRRALANKLAISRPAVSMALRRGQFPAAWWPAACEMGRRAGRLPAESWFSFHQEREPAE